MLEAPLAPYLLWAKTRQPAAIDLAGSNVRACTIADLPGARDAVELSAPNDLGFAPLVEAIAARYGVATDRIATGAGCSGANFLVFAALVASGDRVLVERPTYDPLPAACRLMGADVVCFERRASDAYRIDLDALRRLLATPTRLVVLSTPHNPTGTMLTRDEVAAVGALADAAGALVLVDEVYLEAAAIAGGEAPTARSAAGLDGPFVVTNSLTKSYGLSGLRCGWIVAAPAIAERIRRTRDLVDNIGAGPADRLAAFAFQQLPRLEARTRAILTANLARASAFFEAHPQLRLASPPAASIVFPELRGVDDATPFARHLLDDHGVAVAPGSYFDSPACVRIGIGGDPVIVDRGLDRIATAIGEWRVQARNTGNTGITGGTGD
jgi:aspartate/methionine/tyrosine aminotransferase